MSLRFLTQFKSYSPGALLGDLRGGAGAALVGIPTELIYGLIATAPLGIAYQTSGVVAAFNACIVAAVAGAVGGIHLGQIPGSRPALALICAALLGELMMLWPQWFGQLPQPPEVMLVLFSTVILSGIFQLAFGIFRLGHLLKFLPAPVLSGITNGVAVLMVIQILKPLLGVPRTLGWLEIEVLWSTGKPLSILIGLIAAYLYVNPPRAVAKLPPILSSLVASIVAYYGLSLFVSPDQLGPTFGVIPATLPVFLGSDIAQAVWTTQHTQVLKTILPYAFTIAALASLESLVAAAAVDNIRHTRHVSNHELVAQGIGNIASGLFGGVPVAATMPRTMLNIAGGARTSAAALVYAATTLALILLIPQWIGAIPQVATAGMLLGVGWQMIDPWSRKTVRAMLMERQHIPAAQWRSQTRNGFVMLGAALATVFLGLVWALALGIVLTTLFFLRATQKDVVRSVSSGLEKRSLRVRSVEQGRFLDLLGGDIIIVEAQGPLFFASADKLRGVVERRAMEGDAIILDLARVRYVDATAARVLMQLVTSMRNANKSFVLSGLTPTEESRAEMTWMLAEAGLASSYWYADLDAALEAMEDKLLEVRFDPQDRWRHFALGESTLAAGFAAQELAVLAHYLQEERFSPNELIFSTAESGDSLYVLTRGAASLYLDLTDGKRMRLAAFSAGTVLGELAMLEGKPRIGTAIADVDVVALKLSTAAFQRLVAEYPEVAAKVYRNLSAILAERLRHTLDSLRVAVSD